jgi:hypothetical protein
MVDHIRVVLASTQPAKMPAMSSLSRLHPRLGLFTLGASLSGGNQGLPKLLAGCGQFATNWSGDSANIFFSYVETLDFRPRANAGPFFQMAVRDAQCPKMIDTASSFTSSQARRTRRRSSLGRGRFAATGSRSRHESARAGSKLSILRSWPPKSRSGTFCRASRRSRPIEINSDGSNKWDRSSAASVLTPVGAASGRPPAAPHSPSPRTP